MFLGAPIGNVGQLYAESNNQQIDKSTMTGLRSCVWVATQNTMQDACMLQIEQLQGEARTGQRLGPANESKIRAFGGEGGQGTSTVTTHQVFWFPVSACTN